MSFPIEQQLEANWCWAAVSNSTDHYFDPNSGFSQCKIASQVLNQVLNQVLDTDCCRHSDSCDKAMPLQDALRPLQRLAEITGPIQFQAVKAEIDARRPIAVRIAWFDGGAHFVVICGYAVLQSGERRVEIADSFHGEVFSGKYFGTWTIDFDHFPAWYQQGGSWSATFKLQARPGETP